ncbi:hypothetical protein NDU88_001040 [Pleurodeles waltl]|uniref:Uncharacterized protein n=1 Tax=Pleurodeles waltl TaxID=8319 RepID=A0AAV7SZ48_PLEWA|nr:hypothetical protein NDU88_001038 [Pleurodeles waltl]KAJ1169134.1 hypothetical protein NDU88_001040 [Pleurodeles waltl]
MTRIRGALGTNLHRAPAPGTGASHTPPYGGHGVRRRTTHTPPWPELALNVPRITRCVAAPTGHRCRQAPAEYSVPSSASRGRSPAATCTA